MTVPALINADGSPLVRAAKPPRMRAALNGSDSWAFPYDAASWYTKETEGWFPYVYSPDHEINVYRDRMVGRVRDLVRNDGWASGGVTRILDSTIGGSYRLIAAPDYRFLARRYGSKFDAAWAKDYRTAVEAEFRDWAEDPCFFCDAAQQLTIGQIFYLALRHKLIDGEPLAALEWHPEYLGYGGAHYATTIRLIDPDRMSNPYEMVDTMHRRGGVEIDNNGVVQGYWIRRAHQFDWYGAAESMEWDFVPRATNWGRPVVIHDYDRDRVEQHRGLSVFTPVLNRMKMLTRFDAVSLQAAVLSAVLGLSVESPYDPTAIKEVLADQEDSQDAMRWYGELRADYHSNKPVVFDNARIIPLAPGEKINQISPAHPSAEYDPFMHAMLRHMAAQLGISAEQITQDWSKTNYSSARAALLEAWKTMSRRRSQFNIGFAKRVYIGWLEEAHEIANLPLPSNAPDFVEARGAYSRGRWIGAPRGWVDPVKEAQGAVLRMDAGISTLETEAAEQGYDWEELVEQRALELARMREAGINPPAWLAGIAPQSDSDEPPPANRQAARPRPQ